MANNYANWGWAGSNYNERVYLDVVWLKSEIVNNRSQFRAKVYGNSNNSYGDTGSMSWTLKDQWNQRWSASSGNKPTTNYNQVVDYGTVDFWIYHESDGSMPTINFELNISRALGNTRSATVKVSLSGVATIPRASSITSVGNISVPSLTEVSVAISAHTTAFTHKIEIKHGSTVIVASTGRGAGTQKVALTGGNLNTIMSKMPSATSVLLHVVVTTMSGSTTIGSSVTKAFTAYLDADVRPSISSVTRAEGNASVTSLGFTVYVKNKSTVKVVATRTAGSYSTMKETKIIIGGETFYGTTATSKTLTKTGTVAVQVVATDARGRSITHNSSITVIDHSVPSILAFTGERTNSNGTANEDSNIITIKLKYSAVAVSNQNTASFVLKYRKKGATSWSQWTTATGLTGERTQISSAIFDVNSSYEFELTVTDKFSSVSQTIEVGTSFTLVDYRNTGRGMAIGKVSESDAFEVALRALFTERLTHDNGVGVMSGHAGLLPSGDMDDPQFWAVLKDGYYTTNESSSWTNSKGKWTVYLKLTVPSASGWGRVIAFVGSDLLVANLAGSPLKISWYTFKVEPEHVNLRNGWGQWILGMTYGAMDTINQGTAGSYHPLLRVLMPTGNIFNMGHIGDRVGFYYFDKNRTENGVDGRIFEMDTTNGRIYINNKSLGDFVVNEGNGFRQWSNGVMEQWGTLSAMSPITTAIGSGYRESFAMTFPKAFVGTPVLTLSAGNYTMTSYGALTRTGCTVQLLSFDSGRIADTVQYYAIGKW